MKIFILFAIFTICLFANTSLNENKLFPKNSKMLFLENNNNMKDAIIEQILNQNEKNDVALVKDCIITIKMINK